MKTLKICKTALTVLLILLSAGAATLVLALFKRGFTYQDAMRGAAYLLPLIATVCALSFVTLMLKKRFGTENAQKSCRIKPYSEKEMSARGKNILRGAVICIAVILILLGITNGGLWDVLVKAINICTECIGLG